MNKSMLLGVIASCGLLFHASLAAQAQSSSTRRNQADVLVILPSPQAALSIDNKPTCQTGTNRSFVVSPLDPRGTYSFNLKASWFENGQPVTVEKIVTFRSGQRVVVDFTVAGAPAEGVLRPRIAPESARETPTQSPDDWNRPLTPSIAPEPSR